jgi:hypothetical protein
VEVDNVSRVRNGSTTAGIVNGSPFRIEVTIPIPQRTEVDRLRQEMLNPELSSNQQALVRECFRVAEVLYYKENEPILAARAAVPIVCDLQSRFLITGDRTRLVDVSLAYVAARAEFPMFAIARGFRGRRVRSPAGYVPLDNLLGPIGHYGRTLPVGYLDPLLLIPTDEPRDVEAYQGFAEIFCDRREKILDPVLVVEDPEIPPNGYVVQGHHRTAAAVGAGRQVCAAILRTREDLVHIREELAADIARRCSTLGEFVAACRERSKRLEMRDGRWAAWLASLGPP